MRYECCGCDEDVTQAVEEAFREREWGVKSVTAVDEMDEGADESVTVTCSHGHPCRYTR